LVPLALAAAGAGCQNRPPPKASFSFVDPAHRRVAEVDPGKYKITEEVGAYVDAKPHEPLAAPTFPPGALGGLRRPHVMTVSIKVGADGLVSYLGPSLAAVSIPSEFDQDFVEAIKAALSQWRFEPAHLVRLSPQPDGTPIVTDFEDVEATFEVAFTFAPGGKVMSSGYSKPER
jgi:hypothetical protein